MSQIETYGYPFPSKYAGLSPEGWPQGDRDGSASDLVAYLDEAFTDGIYRRDGAGLLVTAVENSLTIRISPGVCKIRGHMRKVREPMDLTVAGTTTSARTEIVVMRLSTSDDVRSIAPQIIQGSPANTSEVKDIVLARISIPAGSGNLNGATITDTRADPDLCGWVSTRSIWPDNNFFGDGSDGDVTITADTALPSVLNGGYVCKQYKSLTINAGATLTTSNPCAGLVIYVDGTLTINGTIDMSKKAGLGMPTAPPIPMTFMGKGGKTLDKYSYLMGDLYDLPTGGDGGDGGDVISGNSEVSGKGGKGGKGLRNLGGGFGGGGAIGGIPGGDVDMDRGRVEGQIVKSAARSSQTQAVYLPGRLGQGGVYAVVATYTEDVCYRAGAPNGGGTGGRFLTVYGQPNYTESLPDAEYAGGLVVIIARNVVIGPAGRILANGGNGQDGFGMSYISGYVTAASGGGGSGGGVILIYATGFTNNGTLQADAGLGGAGVSAAAAGNIGNPGTAGGFGTIKVQLI